MPPIPTCDSTMLKTAPRTTSIMGRVSGPEGESSLSPPHLPEMTLSSLRAFLACTRPSPPYLAALSSLFSRLSIFWLMGSPARYCTSSSPSPFRSSSVSHGSPSSSSPKASRLQPPVLMLNRSSTTMSPPPSSSPMSSRMKGVMLLAEPPLEPRPPFFFPPAFLRSPLPRPAALTRRGARTALTPACGLPAPHLGAPQSASRPLAPARLGMLPPHAAALPLERTRSAAISQRLFRRCACDLRDVG
mmetsp:Transcript_67945/g.214902  ORF Transcript_67945/g.214902 Transcript_67945/m.214902 type:complete len:245 (+) Transcript_67945:1559-2293(+)